MEKYLPAVGPMLPNADTGGRPGELPPGFAKRPTASHKPLQQHPEQQGEDEPEQAEYFVLGHMAQHENSGKPLSMRRGVLSKKFRAVTYSVTRRRNTVYEERRRTRPREADEQEHTPRQDAPRHG